MRLKRLRLFTQFRGLPKGFAMTFMPQDRQVDFEQEIPMVEPVCFVGLNGSGKSNVMQVLAEIFYHLDVFSRPDAGDGRLTPFGFKIHFQMPLTTDVYLDVRKDAEQAHGKIRPVRDVIIIQRPNKAVYFEIYQGDIGRRERISDPDAFSKLLPQRIIGYSSGMNELISNPFIKMDFFYYDQLLAEREGELRRDIEFRSNITLQNPPDVGQRQRTMNRMFFLDYQSSTLVLLSNFLMRRADGKKGTDESMPPTDILARTIGVEDVLSFRIIVNFRVQKSFTLNGIDDLIKQAVEEKSLLGELFKVVDLPLDLRTTVNYLKDCCTAVNDIKLDGQTVRLELDFWVNESTREAFQNKFRGGPIGLFNQLYTLNLYNIHNYSDEIREIVQKAGYSKNLSDLLPNVAPNEKVFHVDSLRIRKDGKKIYYKQLSDGEHQFLHIAGALTLLDETGTLFLLDEPETHLNPEWRSRFVSALNEISQIKKRNDPSRVEPLQQIVLTTHSPFILSDSRQENIYVFERDPGTHYVNAPVSPGFNTFGASVNLLTSKVFGKRETISGLAKNRLQNLRSKILNKEISKNEAIQEVNDLGDSVEKVIFLDSLDSLPQ